MPSFKKFYKENRKKAIQSQKNSLKLLQLLMILCSYNFIKFSMCSYNFNVAVRISINRGNLYSGFSMRFWHFSACGISICLCKNGTYNKGIEEKEMSK